MPRIDMMFPTVPGNAPDAYALDLLAQILGGGESSRLYQSLVKDQQLATSAAAGIWTMRGSSPFLVQVMVAPGKAPADVEKVIDHELERLSKEPVAAEELARAKTTMRASFVGSLESSVSTANEIGQGAAFFGDPNLINERSAMYAKVTPADVQRVASTYLQPSNRAALLTVPAPKPQAGAPAGAPGTSR
jgi:zinc protease